MINTITYSDRHVDDAYGIRMTSTNLFAVLAQNNALRYAISMIPFEPNYICHYNYSDSNYFIISIAVDRRQKFFSIIICLFKHKCNRWTISKVSFNEDENEVKVWKRKPPELSTLQPHALDVSEASDGFSIAIVAGYHHLDTEKTLPAVYLVRSNPPNNMTLVDNYILYSDTQKIVRGPYVSTDQFDCVLSVSIHDSTQQAFVGVPQLPRSTSWLDDAGIQAGLLLSDTTTLPWSKSRIQVMNVSSNDTVYAYPNNRQTLEQWSSYYRTTDDISNPLKLPIACPLGTYKSVSGPTTPCKICPTMAKSYSTSTEYLVVLKVRLFILTLDCIAWSSDSFCPLASISDANKSAIQSKSQVYAYPTSSSMASFDDILMQNTFNLKTSTDANFACGTSLRNTQFSSALQLSATIKSNKETPIFDMLDTQKFTMIVNFLQAGYTCNDVTAQENIGSYSITLPQTNCIIKSDNAALTIIYRVPYHQMTIQLNLAGPYYIGGVLICLTGPSSAINDSSCLVQNLDYCQLYFTSNQTLGQTTEINFDLTKSINQTESLDYSGATNYSSIWILTSIHGSLNDYLVYLQRGAFLRYLYTQHTIMITFSETEFEFDVINKQEPIV
ncbi:unnamed protein product [Rotaria socialis]|uniref:Uncharacterized protein n=2 Tax=Rotaria socialis TaxID=392032 RepID=A0A817W4K7_9BILA|nr:unnamed protein product [Rotaria socialis]